ncbi:FAD linked oxidase domain protein [uncultured spirochete]|uniref:FAD linked oxidase domain protein n=1 Tax=uncultured spirochete TaxID=156406 RepID=A0A3P3XPE4_9SPIR|nr:FAD linked oxidase domain protein [uncultured spirochete]
MIYNHINKEIISELIQIAGERNVLVDPARIEAFSHDETSKEEYGHMPDVVVTPQSTTAVAEIVRLANRTRIPVTPRGAGSGLSGGAIPVYGGIVLSLEKMNRVREIDYDNLTMTVETGIVTNEINNLVKDKGLFYAGYPMSLETCTLGGNIAENAGGGKAIKYGVTSRYILGLEFVTPAGEVVWLGGKLAKDVTGYDLVHLIVGSEGTLGIATAAIIKLIGLPAAKSDLLVLFHSPQEAISCVPIILSKGLIPTAIEFMDRRSVETSCAYLNENLPYAECGAMLLIEMDGRNPALVESETEAVGDLCMEQGAIEVYVADNRTTQERLWAIRRNIAEAFKVYCPVQSLEDIVVPPAAIPAVIPELDRISEQFGITIPCYGHAGDGNLHATLVKAPGMPLEDWQRIEPQALAALYEAITKLGGKISGEHGIGLKRKEFMKKFMIPTELELLKTIKRAWDPNLIMNPGKIFDMES